MAAKSLEAGRSVSPIPLIPGGGTYCAGQAAFGYTSRGNRMFGDRMFAPTKMWRRQLYAYGNITAIPLPAVMLTPVRPDVVNYVRAQISNNSRQPYEVSNLAGHQTSAKSWGTGRAISRIPRVSVPSLVMARGHKIESVPEFPLVVSDSIESVEETSEAVKVLKRIGAFADAEKAKDSVGVHSGKGKIRSRRYISRKGPLIVYKTKGSFVIWTKSAFEKLESIYGSFEKLSEKKKGYVLPRPKMLNADLARIINSDDVQSVVKPMKKDVNREVRL
ncbi:60S ribosomal protein L4 C-terminal domain [Arabidopsis suecica]|uniref:60S ribosomal protein L4 C-terminal domain n=1 Tax=Arabidopsis suecica TaxID=45249 RepID=A0A8T2CNT3_ARASU|nr:60S ribosomal protein L4 C-terminal domain [Arabidopsis suecica]